MTSPFPRLRTHAAKRFVAVWTQRATVVRPSGAPVFDPATGTYTDATSTVATGVACNMQTTTLPEQYDVAGDPQTLTRLELKYDPSVSLKVDDRVTFTTHDDSSVQGETFTVTGVAAAYQHVYGLAWLVRAEPDSGA